jgi:uncharacterized protein (TIGR02186 family)
MKKLILALIMMAAPALADESLVTGVSRDDVQITADFTGSDILVYGAVLRNSPPPLGQELDVIVTLEGPPSQVVVRRKERLFGIWINAGAVQLDDVPSYFAIAATRPVEKILSADDDLRFDISLHQRINVAKMTSDSSDFSEYPAALNRIRVASGSYQTIPSPVQLSQDTLFRADFALPANVTEGDFRVRLFLLRNGRVLDSTEQVIMVRKTGIERQLTNMANEQPFIYGLLSLLMALVAGWGASAAFRAFQR